MTYKSRPTQLFIGLTLAIGALPGCLAAPGSATGGSKEDRQQALGILCEANVNITGQMAAGAAQPADVFGCWPVGTWTFTASVVDSDCGANTPALESSYSFSVARDAVDQTESYVYLNDPANDKLHLSVSSGGGGLCTGNLALYSPDGKVVVNLKPTLQADGTLIGKGEIEVYETAQF